MTAAKTAAAIVGVAVLSVGPSACGSDSGGSASTNESGDPASAPKREAGALPTTGAGNWELTWSDEFNGPSGSQPDPAKWGYKLGSSADNAERQLYTNSPRNAAMNGEGSLVITALKETPPGSSCWYGTCTYTSARIRTANKFSQRYGRFEARIEVPSGKGIWPAFWMLGDDAGNVGWPQQGEIDVMEILGHEPAKVYGSLHGPGYSGSNSITKSYTLPEGQSFAAGFHTFAVEWEPQVVRWYVDDQLYETRTPADLPAGARWVYDNPFYMILNLAVGGYWPGDPDASTKFPAEMKVDFVRVFKQATAP